MDMPKKVSSAHKIFIAAFVGSVMVAPSLFGASLNSFCSPLGTFTGGGGSPTTETCGSFGTDGGGTIGSGAGQETITSVEIFFITGYTTGFGASNSVSVTYGTPSAGSFSVPGADPCVITGATTSTANTCSVYSGNLNAPGTTSETSGLTGAALQTFAGSSFTIGVSSAVTVGAVASSTGDTIVEYDYTVNPASGAPEPATFGLVGFALVGLVLVAHKRAFR